MAKDYQQSFLQLLEQLNEEQRAAVQQLEGPVWVLAGPGTGKTHILAARIGRILMETDTQAYNILCLTFTDAGVQAMRNRLLQFIGPEAHRVHLFTFHSFCNKVIQENLYAFGHRELEPASRLDQLEVARSLLEELPLDSPLVKGRKDPFFHQPHLLHLFAHMKKEGLSPQQVRAAAEDYLAHLDQNPAHLYKRNTGKYEKGMLKPRVRIKAQERMALLTAAADLFPAYQQKKKKKRRFDYEDMILWVLQAFRERPMLLRRYQEQYLYVLVDEFQDTNGAQNEVLKRLIEYWESPNVFIVGDDDQSIYEFQGARLKHLVDFYHQYAEALRTVVLRKNYRSSTHLLQLTGAFIRRNTQRAISLMEELNKDLIAANKTVAMAAERSEIRSFATPIQEQAWVVNRIRALLRKGVPAREIAVIYARHSQGEPYIHLLDKLGIPFFTHRNMDLLQQPIIRQLWQLLRYLDQENQQPLSGEEQLPQLLHFPFWKIPAVDIARISLQMPSEKPWRLRLLEVDPKIGSPALRTAGQFLEESLKAMHDRSLLHFLEWVANRSGLLLYVLQHPEKDRWLQQLQAFFQYVQAETRRRPALQLTGLLRHFQTLQDARLPVLMPVEGYQENGIQLLTAHASKGLEFEYVFLVDARKNYWEPSLRRSSRQFFLPEELTLSGETDAMEARRRLWYVAITRAKRQVLVSFPEKEEQDKAVEHARFVDEMAELLDTTPLTEQVSPKDMSHVRQVWLHLERPPMLDYAPDQDFLRRRLAQYRLSISGLNAYLRCPLAFYHEHLLQLPSPLSESAAYGLAVHRAVEQTQTLMLREQHPNPVQAADLLQYFEREMHRLRSFFGEKAYQLRLQNGRQHLPGFFEHALTTLPEEALLEYNIQHATFRDIPLRGVIDRVDLLKEGTAVIVDYKTGDPIRGSRRAKEPNDKTPEGGPYWRQLVFYKILFESLDRYNRVARKGQLWFTEPMPDGSHRCTDVSLDGAAVQLVGDLIEQSWEGIQALQFEGCGEDHCVWCQLHRLRQLPDSLADEEAEGLDDFKT